MYALLPVAAHPAFHMTHAEFLAAAVILGLCLLFRWLATTDGWALACMAILAALLVVVYGKDMASHKAAAALPAPKPKPAPTRTVIVQHTTHTITRVVTHSGLPPWAIVIIAVFAFGTVCALFVRRSA